MVETAVYTKDNGQLKTMTGNNASGNKGTIGTINATSLSFGHLAPGETSETVIIALRAPYAKTIDNIKIALINTGDIPFSNNVFGIEFRNYIDYNIKPSSYFQGVNEDNEANNVNNIDIENKDNISSQYVYLNVSLPTSQGSGAGVIRLKWYFDYV
jgi:hypothetical protein